MSASMQKVLLEMIGVLNTMELEDSRPVGKLPASVKKQTEGLAIQRSPEKTKEPKATRPVATPAAKKRELTSPGTSGSPTKRGKPSFKKKK